jgi:hypothetical protein
MNNLQTYLNDHLAGSVGALEMLDHHIASLESPEMRTFLARLREEIGEDQNELKELLHRVNGRESDLRKAGAWLVEKLGRSKLQGEENDLGFMQMLETLSLGILGKRAMWRTLAAAMRGGVAELRGVDYPRLEARAGEQFARVEAKIFERASVVLGRSE